MLHLLAFRSVASHPSLTLNTIDCLNTGAVHIFGPQVQHGAEKLQGASGRTGVGVCMRVEGARQGGAGKETKHAHRLRDCHPVAPEFLIHVVFSDQVCPGI